MNSEIDRTTSIWDKRYKDGEIVCTKNVVEKDPLDYTQHALLYQHSIAKRLTGSISGDPIKQIASHFLNPPANRILSIGCGMAFHEQRLVENGFANYIVAYEASQVAVESARDRIKAAGLEGKIELRCGDVMQAGLLDESFDVVMVMAAIHHFYEIEAMFALMHRVLLPNGLLIFDEYIGPDHHQYESEVVAVLDDINNCLGEKHRWDVLRKETRESVSTATLEWMLSTDPSEGVHSSQILPLTYKYFDVLYREDYAGAIMRPFWVGILPNFDFEDEKDASIAKLIILMEDYLTRHGVIPNYHTQIVGKKRLIPKQISPAQTEKINYSTWPGIDEKDHTLSLKSTEVVYKLQNYTDDNWINGIANKWATAFFIKNSSKAKADLAVGKKVIFSDGTKRMIVKQQENNDSLIVSLEGPVLDGNEVGYPNGVKICFS
jgi:ubiquinone/menaquinone biosynthesis C-methylase UbiE